ncbi:MAG: GreA/GreB family elongation factor [Bacteroidia bacterium]|nr:GreA/GreB family elongation factor [Bacteroidia bacterium]
MKPILSESAYNTLYNLLQKIKSPEGKQLGAELSKAKIVKDPQLCKDVVTLNSEVEFIADDLNKPVRLKIVLPEEADLSQKKISVLAPISIALIGFKESYAFDWILPSGKKKLKIIKVVNL